MKLKPDWETAKARPRLWLAAVPAAFGAAYGSGNIAPWAPTAAALAIIPITIYGALGLIVPWWSRGLTKRWMCAAMVALVWTAAFAGLEIRLATMTPAQRAAFDRDRAASDAAVAAADARRKADRAAKDAAAKASAPPRPAGAAAYKCGGVSRADPYLEAKWAVEPRLKNPRGAKFGGLGETRIAETQRCHFTVVGWVDATNSYGATIRTRYGVDLVHDPLGDKWRVAEVLIE
jgi:hypothetical protein